MKLHNIMNTKLYTTAKSETFNKRRIEMKSLKEYLLADVGIAVLIGSLICSGAAQAVDGVVLINQSRALAGNVTSGDAPGFPVTITKPGSYRLSGNLTVPAGTDGIVIAADEVTLDLNGFLMSGGAARGVTDNDVARRNIAIHDGTVRFGDTGIDMGNSDGAQIRRVRVQNHGFGIRARERRHREREHRIQQ